VAQTQPLEGPRSWIIPATGANHMSSDIAASEPRVSVVIPAYDEAGGVGECLRSLLQALAAVDFTYEVIVVDDGSTDGTGDEARKVEGVTLIQHRQNLGYGAALKTGIRAAHGEIIVITDADGTYPVERIPDLVREMPEFDMVVGARTGEQVRVPALRKPAKWFLARLAGYLTEADIPDLNSGLRAFRRSDALRLFGILPSGFSFTTTITLAMLWTGMRVGFVPIDYHQRKGRSKIRPIRDTYNFIVLIVRTISYFNPLKVFLPAAGLVLALGVGKTLYDALVFADIYDTDVLLVTTGLILGAMGLLADIVAQTRVLSS